MIKFIISGQFSKEKLMETKSKYDIMNFFNLRTLYLSSEQFKVAMIITMTANNSPAIVVARKRSLYN